MKPTDKQQIDAALMDVRRAYRLLHDYQRMVMDAVQYVGQQLGLAYGGGFSKFSSTTPRDGRTKGLRDTWAWDWLNMVLYEFHFTKALTADQSLRLSLLVISDTGYFCATDEALEKPNVSKYLPVAQSQTKLAFIMSATGWDFDFTGDKGEMKSLIETGQLPARCREQGMRSMVVDLHRIADETETGLLIDEVVALGKLSGITLGRVEGKQ